MTAPASTLAELATELGVVPGTDAYVWLEELEDLGPPPPDLAPDLLGPVTATARLALLGVSQEDAADVLATLPEPGGASWWCLEREVHRLAATMGDPDAYRGRWPSFEGAEHSLSLRCHFAHVAIATMPFTLAYLSRLGIPSGIASASLADVARHMAIHRRMHGCTGIEAAWWVTLCLRGEIVDLGRLQFNRFTLGIGDETPLWYPGEVAEEMGPGFRRGDPCLGIHIPEGEPLDPQLVEESLGRAASYFAEYYPVARRRVATCLSWLLDDQLADYLPEGSNIVQFQRRFELVPGWYGGDDNIVQFVFRQPADVSIDSLPQTTVLERAVVAHLRSGRHWRIRTGWLDLS